MWYWRYVSLTLFLKALPVVFLGFHLALALAPPINFPVDKISFLFALEEHLLTRLKWLTKKGFQKLETVWEEIEGRSFCWNHQELWIGCHALEGEWQVLWLFAFLDFWNFESPKVGWLLDLEGVGSRGKLIPLLPHLRIFHDSKHILISLHFTLSFVLSSQYSPHSYCAPPPARARSGHWPPPHVSENWSIIQIANTTILSKYHNFIHEPKTKYHTFIQIPIIKFAKPHFYPKTKIEVGPVNVFLKNSSFSLVCIVCSSSW